MEKSAFLFIVHGKIVREGEGKKEYKIEALFVSV